ncbi:acyltransferase [Desulfosporosinus sp. OT]|uniref:acyltransferase n=1 Tax=Desulfosporosinus sp. OT TaxID=913865 RepID=UPI000223A32D|nr:acyltransferase [Desulfosporosinus sp. OT]EGW37830.1 bacterial transferase hexapeptide family protein [Desulfosporosinus sp. OT]
MDKFFYRFNQKYRRISDLFTTRYILTRYFFIFENVGKNVVIRAPFRINIFNIDPDRYLKISLGNNTIIKSNVIIQGQGRLSIGDQSYISENSVIGCNEEIQIGKAVMLATGVSIRDTDHKFDNISIDMVRQGIVTSKVVIEDNVWIGANVSITKGVRIGTGSIVAANAVVTKDVEQFSVVGGVPAKLIKYRTGTL